MNMKKMKFFSRAAAAVLTLAMLLPCVLSTPSSAAEGMETLYHYKAVANGNTGRDKFRNTEFPNNVSIMHPDLDGITRAYGQYSYTMYGPDGPYKVASQAMEFGTDPTYTYATNGLYTGRPVQVLNDNSKACKLLDAVRFELGGVDYPVITRGLGALNISFVYMVGSRSLGLMDELKVSVSLDGETWLKDGAGIRSHKLLGSGTKGYMYRLETENLLDIEGMQPNSRIMNIMIQPFETDNTQASEVQFYTLDLNAYYTKADFDRLVPADVREYVHVGEETMRQIVVEEASRTANTPWTTDSIIHTKSGLNYIVHMPGIPFRGCTYENNIDSSRELFQSKIVDGKWMGGNNQDNLQGMDCQTFVYNAASRVSRSTAFACMYTAGAPGMSLLGKEFLNIPENGLITFTNYDVIRTNTQQDLFRSYALAKPGDHELTYTTKFDMNSQAGNHVRIVTDNHVEYNADGTINGEKSYFLSAEQAMFPEYEIELADGSRTSYTPTGSEAYEKLQNYMAKNPGAKILYAHSAHADSKQSYSALYNGDYVVYTNDHYATGNIELQRVETIISPKTAGTSIENGGVYITCSSNYRLLGWGAKLEDRSTGEVLYDDYALFSGSNSVWACKYTSEVLDAKLAGLTNGSYRLSFVTESGPFTALGQTKVPTNVETYDFTVSDRAPAAQVTLGVPGSAAKGQNVEVAVTTAAAADSAVVEVKFDTTALTYVSATQTDDVFVTCSNGLLRVMAADAGIPAGGTLTKLTFTANADVAKLTDAIQIKSAQIVTAAAANTSDAVKATDGTDVCASINFADVHRNAWYHHAVDYAVETGIMSGYNAATFGPNDKLSRAMVVQVLYNYEGKPAVEAEGKFPDVKSGDWYFNATGWGAEKGVVSGYGDGRFGPNDNVTIEQVAVILHNYSGKPAASGDLTSVGKYDDWAAGALQWAVANGVLKNVPFTNATETATRAQTAQMLMNYLNK